MHCKTSACLHFLHSSSRDAFIKSEEYDEDTGSYIFMIHYVVYTVVLNAQF